MKNWVCGCAALAIAIALVGCSKGSDDTAARTDAGTAGAKPDASGKTFKLAFVTNNVSPFWTIARKGVEKADAELDNVTVEFKMPADGSAAAQRQIVDDLLAKGMDGMAISPVDPKNQTDMINAAAKSIVVLTQDSDAPSSDRACYIGTDNVAAGKQAGEELKKSLPNGGKVMIFVGESDAQNAHDRIAGLKEAVAGTKIVILDVRTDHADRTKAKSNVADTLVKEADIAALVGIWSYNGPAILNAVKDANKVGKVKIVCFDEEDETLAGVKAGSIDATVVQQPFEFGYQSVQTIAKYLSGDKSVIPANKMNIVPTLVLHKDDVDEFKKKLDALRKPKLDLVRG